MKMKPILFFSLLLFIIFYQPFCTPKMYTRSLPFDLQGHRGCRGLMPENTIPAMLKAIDLGVTTLEMDVVITKDSEVILSHEPWMNAEISTKPNGKPVTEAEAPLLNIYRMTYAEAAQYDVGSKVHPRFPEQQKSAVHKPLLKDVIKSVEAHLQKNGLPPAQYNIETKTSIEGDGIYHPSPQQFIELLLPIIKNHGLENRTIIQSFDIRTLQYLHSIDKKIKTALLIEEGDTSPLKMQLQELGFTPSIFSTHFSLVTEQLVSACHAMGIRVIPRTVNELDKMKSLKSMGVDGLISDYPNLFQQL